MSFIFTYPFEKTIAFVGVATGSINAKLIVSIKGRRKKIGLIYDSIAYLSKN